MIYSASSLLLTTLVFNAASVWGAPVPVYSDSSAVVRSTADDIVPRKITTVDVLPQVRSVDPEQVVDARDTACSSSECIEARDPLPEVERIVRRYPRKVYQDFYEKRSPSPEAESPPVARSEVVVERRYPRRALYERHEARSEPAPPVEARSDPEPAEIQRRYPRKVYADYYEKREPSPPSPVEARAPAPELTDSGRRFPRRVYAEYYEKRQDAADPATPPADPATPPAPPAADPAVSPSPTVATPQVSSTVTLSASTSTATSPVTPNVPLDLNRVVQDINTPPANGYQPGTTIKETTLLVNKITHISDKVGEVKPADLPPSSASPATPSSSAPAASSSAPAAAAPTPTAADDTAAPPPAAAAESTPTPAAGADAPADGATPPATGDASRRSIQGSNQASRQPIIRRELGYSGPAWASHMKRTVN